MKVTFLGTGTSVGKYLVLDAPVQYALRRTVRTSGSAVRASRRAQRTLHSRRYGPRFTHAGPYLRRQPRGCGALHTHGHADHLYGLDDVRSYCFEREDPLPCYADARTIERIKRVFDYAFDANAPSATPQIELVEIKEDFKLFDLAIQPIYVYHGRLPVLAFRIGDFAYVTDTNRIPDEGMERLQQLDVSLRCTASQGTPDAL